MFTFSAAKESCGAKAPVVRGPRSSSIEMKRLASQMLAQSRTLGLHSDTLVRIVDSYIQGTKSSSAVVVDFTRNTRAGDMPLPLDGNLVITVYNPVYSPLAA